jgi:hypothetical protein
MVQPFLPYLIAFAVVLPRAVIVVVIAVLGVVFTSAALQVAHTPIIPYIVLAVILTIRIVIALRVTVRVAPVIIIANVI